MIKINDKIKRIINLCLLIAMFVGYALTFIVPKFYGLTDRFVGVFVFLVMGVLLAINIDIREHIKNKSIDLIILFALLVITLVNLFIVKSGFGAFFIAANFTIIMYISKYLCLTKKDIDIVLSLYLAYFLVWLIFAYPGFFADYRYYAYNTNTAATFITYTFLVVYMLLERIADRYKWVNVVIVVLFVRIIRLAMWHRARGAFIMLGVFIVLKFAIMKPIVKSKVLFGLLTVLSTAGSLLFVAFYTLIGRTGVNMRIPFFYKDMFSGRQDIWHELFQHFIKSPITGTGTNFEIESFMEFNVHNAMYNLLVIYGVVVFIGIMFFVFRRMFEFREICNIDSKNSKYCITAISVLFAVFMESFLDVDLIWADYALNLLCVLSSICIFGKNNNGEV